MSTTPSTNTARPQSDVPIDAILRMIPVHNSHDPKHALTAMAIRAVNREYLHSSRLCWRSKCYAHPQDPEKMYLTEEYGNEEEVEVEVTDDEIPDDAATAEVESGNGGGNATSTPPKEKRKKTILRQRLLVELELTHPTHAATAMRILGGTY
eukprot:GFYU01031199.1.p1 GENE.GFYU01031199.1~~GFYU01031199.1.p1  ORF type:complete len:152 (+),score=15.79 GFYU01031199.1:67-522(+)